MWEHYGFAGNYKPFPFNDGQNDLVNKFFANNKSYNFERAIELEQTTVNSMNLEKYLYKYCLNYY